MAPFISGLGALSTLEGGHHDCRNRLLHQMFRYVGIGDQAGSGIPKIMSGWRDNHWRSPEMEEQREPFEQTQLHMRMIDLFPAGIVEQLRALFNDAYDQIEHAGQVALAIAASEGTVTHEKLKIHTQLHTADLSRILRDLVRQNLLCQTGSSRGAVYHISGFETPNPDDVFGTSPIYKQFDGSVNGNTSLVNNISSSNNAGNSPNNGVSSLNSGGSSPNNEHNRDEEGCIISEHMAHPIVDAIEKISEGLKKDLFDIASDARAKKRIPPEKLEKIILDICTNRYITIAALSEILNRKPDTLRGQHLTKLVRSKEMVLAFPKTPNDPRQAYRKA